MFNRVILIMTLLFSTQVGAHQNSCPIQLLPVSARMEAYGHLLAELASQAALLTFQMPEYREKLAPTIARIVELQVNLGQVRQTKPDLPDLQAALLSAFEMKLAHHQTEISSTIRTGLIMYGVEPAPLRRGAQHPDRPMKRETLRFNEIPGLEDWPYDFSAEGQNLPLTQTGSPPGPVLPPDFWDWQIPGLNWPPREKP